MGDLLFFSANDSALPVGERAGAELWKSDGTGQGTMQVKDIRPGRDSSLPQQLMDVNGTLFFTADDGAHGRELWKSDGTESGTKLVSDLAPGTASSDPHSLETKNKELYFFAASIDSVDLWKTDAASLETSTVWQNPSNQHAPSSLTNVAGTLFFASDSPGESELWVSDGTADGTNRILGREGNAITNPEQFTTLGGSLVFTSDATSIGHELWTSNGSTGDTFQIADIPSGTGSSHPSNLTRAQHNLFFSTRTDQFDWELWLTDTTTGETKRLAELPDRSAFYQLTDVGDGLAFIAKGQSGMELWSSDGTATGTAIVKTFAGGSTTVDHLTDVDGTLFFRVRRDSSSQLWKSDGSATGTVMIKQFTADEANRSIRELLSVDGTLFFVAYDRKTGVELWTSDGTTEGTQILKDIVPGQQDSLPDHLREVNGTVFFTADNGFWSSDGAETGTKLVRDNLILVGEATNIGNIVYFSGIGFGEGDDTSAGLELWKSDGTEAGTVLVKDIHPLLPDESMDSHPHDLTVIGETLYFVAYDGTTDAKLWKSDGTEEGTVSVTDMSAGNLADISGTLVFTSNGGFWKLDPERGVPEKIVTQTEAPTIGFAVAPFDREIYFAGDSDVYSQELFRLTFDAPGSHRTGDFNKDGVTDFADFLILSANFGQEVVDAALGDADEDGLVSFADFLLLSANFSGLVKTKYA